MSNTTTISRGWKLTRQDGQVLAFTDCDVDLVVEGVTYRAAHALTASEATQALGTAVDDMEVEGGLSSEAITESDLTAGLYDGAQVEVLEIDWTTETRHATVGDYYLGEVSRTPGAFAAELRSEAGRLAQKRGRYITATCDAELGDARCGVVTTGLSASGAVSTVTGTADFLVSGLEAHGAGEFISGTLVWTSGANLGQTQEVRAQGDNFVGLWRAPLFDVAPGDTFDILPGCPKTFAACRDRFSNAANFRGFPHVAGEAVLEYAIPGEAGLDGGSRNG